MELGSAFDKIYEFLMFLTVDKLVLPVKRRHRKELDISLLRGAGGWRYQKSITRRIGVDDSLSPQFS